MSGERGVTLYDHSFKSENLNNLKRGDVIVYRPEGCSADSYLVVSDVDLGAGEISGQIASACGVNSVPLEILVGNSKNNL